MITFTVKFHKLAFKGCAHLFKGLMQNIHMFIIQTSSAILGNKYQVYMHIKCTMPTMSKVLIKFHRPIIISV